MCQRPVRTAMLALIGGAAVACGGGGGGGGGAPAGASGGGANQTTPSTPVRFDEPAAIVAGSTLVASLEETWVVTALADFAVLHLAANGNSSDLHCIQIDGTEVPINYVFTDRDTNAVVSRGDAIRLTIDACDGYNYDISIDLTSATPWVNSYLARIRFTDRFPDGAVLTGSFDFEAPIPRVASGRLRITGLAATYARAGQTETIAGAAMDAGLESPFTYDYAFSGKVTSDRLRGTYTFSSLEAIRGERGRLPFVGVIELVGNNSRARLRVLDDQLRRATLGLEIDSSGTGTFGPVQAVQWTELVTGALFGWLPHEPPVITSLTLEPDRPTGVQPIVARFAGMDPEGRGLRREFEWRVNGARVLGGSLGTSNQLSFDPLHFAKRDTVEFRFTVSDGDYAVEDSRAVSVVNSPPAISLLRLTPSMPTGFQSVNSQLTAADPDQEPLITTYSWYVNDELLPEYRSPSLPPAAFAARDVVRLVVTVTDREASALASATVTIADLPPTISFEEEPIVQVAYDALFTAEFAITDMDGDPVDDIDYLLAYGPSGMSVDPATGVLSWLDKGPMYREEMIFNYGVTIDAPGANVVSGTVEVVDPERERALYRTTYEYEAPDYRALFVDDFDADGANEMLVVADGSIYELEYLNGTYRRTWQHPGVYGEGAAEGRSSPADLDGDGRAELFVGTGAGLGVLGGEEWSWVDFAAIEDLWSGFSASNRMMASDLEQDGRLEIVTASPDRLRVFDAESLELVRDLGTSYYGYDLAIGNVDADAQLEIVFASGKVYDGLTFVQERDFGHPDGRRVVIGDLDADGIGEVVLYDTSANLVRAYSALSGTGLWTIPRTDASVLHMANISGGLEDELIVGDGRRGDGYVTVYRDDGGPSPELIAETAAYTDSGVVAIVTGDVDNDGETEIVFAEEGVVSFTVTDADMTAIEWSTAALPTPLGAFASRGVDLARRGSDPPQLINVVNFIPGAALVAVDPESGELQYSSMLGDTTSESYALEAADYDNDSTDEVLVIVTEDDQTTLKIVDFFTDTVEWASPPLVWGSWPDAARSGDLTGDGQDEIVALHDDRIYAFDVTTSQQIWTTLVNSSTDQQLRVGDVNGRGNAEVIVAAGSVTIMYSSDDGPISEVARFSGAVTDVAVGDVDGDGETEVFVLYKRSQDSVVYRLNSAFELQSMSTVQQRASGIAIEKSSHARVNLILWSSEVGVSAVDPFSGAEIWRWGNFSGDPFGSNAVRYVEIGGEYRILLNTTQGVYLTQ